MSYALADMLNAGEMTQRITLRATALDSNDEPIDGAAIAEDVPASKRALRGREIVESGRDVGEQWTEFRIRYRTGLDHATRVESAGQAYDVEAIDDPTGNRRVLVITAKVVK